MEWPAAYVPGPANRHSGTGRPRTLVSTWRERAPRMVQHPLEPLSADEFRQTASILRREGLVRDTFRFASIELKEPPKGEVRAWRPGDAVRRTSFAVVFNREDNQAYEATVDLSGRTVVSFE